jgi:hypothetical protein
MTSRSEALIEEQPAPWADKAHYCIFEPVAGKYIGLYIDSHGIRHISSAENALSYM